MFRYALLATCSFALGVLVRDVAQDYRDAKVLAACESRSAEYASHLSKLLTDGRASYRPGHRRLLQGKTHTGEVMSSAAWLRLLRKVCKVCGYTHYNYRICPICKRYK